MAISSTYGTGTYNPRMPAISIPKIGTIGGVASPLGFFPSTQVGNLDDDLDKSLADFLVGDSGGGDGGSSAPSSVTGVPGQGIGNALGLSQGQTSIATSAVSIGMQSIGIPGMVASPIATLAMTNDPEEAMEAFGWALATHVAPQIAIPAKMINSLVNAFSSPAALTVSDQQALAQVMQNMQDEALMDQEMAAIALGISPADIGHGPATGSSDFGTPGISSTSPVSDLSEGISVSDLGAPGPADGFGDDGIGAADGSIGGLGGLGGLGDSVGSSIGFGGEGALGGIGGIGGIGSVGDAAAAAAAAASGDGDAAASGDGDGGDGGDGGGGGGGGGGASVICTHLHETGNLSTHIYQSDSAYGRKLILRDPAVYYGYRRWADTVVSWMKSSTLVLKAVKYLAMPIILALAEKENKEIKSSAYGRFALNVGTKICRYLGKNLSQTAAMRCGV